MPKRRRSLALVLALALSLSGCRATGRAANAYLDATGRIFTTNPVSAPFYYVGFGLFFVAGLPLDLITLVATWIAWPDGAGSGEDYQGSALAPSIFLGATGGSLLGAPFFPFGLPWWDPDREDDEAHDAPAKAPPPAEKKATVDEKPRSPDDPDDAPAGGGPRR